jgi:hypothetical protein
MANDYSKMSIQGCVIRGGSEMADGDKGADLSRPPFTTGQAQTREAFSRLATMSTSPG